MKKLRNVLFTLAILTLCLLLLPTEADAAGVWDLTFKLNNSGTGYVVTDCNEAASGKLTIPKTYKEKPVAGIGWDAFRGCTSLTSVTIPNSVTTIGNSAFRDCTSLTSVTIPDSVTSIGYCTFNGCTSLTSVTIPDSVTYIDECAFSNCTSLKSVTIPDSVTTIDDSAFDGCTNLTGIHVAAGNSKYSSDNCGVLFNKNKTELIKAPGAINGTYTVPDSVTSIGIYAFRDCTSLTSVAIPDSVTSIGMYAFDCCTSLKSVTIPDSVTGIGWGAFYGCTSLTSVTIPDSVT